MVVLSDPGPLHFSQAVFGGSHCNCSASRPGSVRLVLVAVVASWVNSVMPNPLFERTHSGLRPPWSAQRQRSA